MIIRNHNPIKCRELRIKLFGKASSRFEVRDSRNRVSICSHSRVYSKCIKTIWGKLLKTMVINEAGSYVFFGPPYAPDEGILRLVINKHNTNVIIRVE